MASAYPNISGITPLKEQASRFIKAFLNVDVNPEGCVPTVGSMMGTFASFITCTHLSPEKDTILFIDPGFSVQPLQAKVLATNESRSTCMIAAAPACVTSWKAS